MRGSERNPATTNAEFLDAIFARSDAPVREVADALGSGHQSDAGHGGVFISSVYGDPSTGNFGYSDDTYEDRNNYFCVSRVRDRRRLVENFVALHCLVVDDVGPKVDPDLILGAFGPPTWITETSPNNYQWGYKLDQPVTDVAVANGMIEALCRFTKIGDMAGVNRLVRLPVGMNLKSSLPTPFKTRMTEWNPDREVSTLVMLSLLGAVPEPPEVFTDPYLPPDRDPVVLQMDIIAHPYERTRDLNKYRVRCPWVDTHSGNRDDGAAYIAPAGFKCHHGHCKDKTFADFREFLGLTAAQIDRAKAEAVKESWFTSEGLSVFVPGGAADPEEAAKSAAGAAAPTIAPVDWTVRRFHSPATHRPLVLGVDAEAAKYARRWLFDGVVLSDGMFILAGQGGEGKSRLALAMCMSAASGIPLGGSFCPTNRNGVRTLFITQEDDDSEKFHRYSTQLEAFSDRHHEPMTYRDWGSEQTGIRLETNLYMPEFDPLDGLSKENEKRLIENQREFGAFELVVWDPLGMFYDDDDAQGVNSAGGTRRTFSRLVNVSKRLAKAAGTLTSVGFVHHFNKTGTLLGSVMQENLCRVVFGMTKSEYPPPGKRRSVISVMKSNAADLRGQCCTAELRGPHATIHLIDSFAPPEPEPEPEEKPKKEGRKKRGD